MKKLYFEFGGGLGDVINQCFSQWHGYRRLCKLAPDEEARVAVISHNPAAKEMFEWLPGRERIEVVDCGYWVDDNVGNRAKHGLPPAPPAWNDDPTAPVRFYSSPKDQEVVRACREVNWRRFGILAPNAGLPDRDLPERVVMKVLHYATELPARFIQVGKNYDRHGRKERDYGRQLGCVSMVDQLSAPGTCALVRRASFVVTCHSSINILAWHLRKPQLLLYPQSVYLRHFRRGDEWSFGRNFPETFHGLLPHSEQWPGYPNEAPAEKLTREFFHYLQERHDGRGPVRPAVDEEVFG